MNDTVQIKETAMWEYAKTAFVCFLVLTPLFLLAQCAGEHLS